MRHHMDSLDDGMAQLAAADFKGAAKVAREQLVPGSGAGFGRYLPVEFREMGFGMHRAAAATLRFACTQAIASPVLPRDLATSADNLATPVALKQPID